MKFICNICNRNFKQKSHLIDHENKKNKCSKDDIVINGKKKYKCNICKKLFDTKCNYIKHINRKIKCSSNNNLIDEEDEYKNNIINENLNIDINEAPQNLHNFTNFVPQIPQNFHNFTQNIEDELECEYCSKIFSRKDALKRHHETCKLKKHYIIGDKKEGNLIGMIKVLQDQIKELSQNKNDYNETINNNNIDNSNNMSNSNNTNISNVNCNNTINNTANINIENVNIVTHGKEDLGLLVKDEVKDILNSGYNCVFKSISYTYFNNRLSQFKNIRYTNPKSSYCQIFVNGKWEHAKFSSVVEDILINHFGEVSTMSTENSDLFESKFRKDLVDEYLLDYKRYTSYETEDIYPENWNLTMKREKQKEVRLRLNKNRDIIKTMILNKSIEIKKEEEINKRLIEKDNLLNDKNKVIRKKIK